MQFVYKYPTPRGYCKTKYGNFQVRTTYKGISESHGTFKTEDEAYAHFRAIQALRKKL